MKYLNAFNRIAGVGPQKIKMLLDFFGSPEKAWRASFSDLLKSGLKEKLALEIESRRNEIDPEAEWEKLAQENIRAIGLDDPDYPRLLKEIPSPPFILYLKGDFDLNLAPIVTIVGSRKNTAYGNQAASAIARSLVEAGFEVASGLALGIDAIAHRATLDAGGKTIAVLGNSLDDDFIHPRANFNLSQEILESGCLISEYPPGTPATPYTFPIRNRILAGLSLGTVIVEAAEKSGTLITAQNALEFNREVFAIPGSIFSPQSEGVNNLIKKGAKLISGIKDILEELNMETNRSASAVIPKIPETPEEKIILKILSHEPVHVDNISKLSKLGTARVSSALLMMEIKGWTKNIGGQNYILM